MSASSPSCRGRLAPSPTGAQHAGNARTYLIAWLRARSLGGRIALRIEDIDSPRVKPAAAEQAIEDLHWLGLDYDEGPLVQTERLALYEDALHRLQEADLVYPCTCTRSDVERAASAPHDERIGAKRTGPAEGVVCYPGICVGRRPADAAQLTQPFSWRFRLPQREYHFEDGFHGPLTVDLHEAGGDFVVWKSVGTPAYQLAVVVDDAAQGITEVVRGDDLIPSTPRQLLLYQALGLQPPAFVHVPLVVGPDGRRLAKRHGDTRLSALREAGVKPEALLGLLAWSCGWLERRREVTVRELLPLFDLASIPREPFVLTPELLRSIGYQS
jgi:glutamyl-tRNA synthetase